MANINALRRQIGDLHAELRAVKQALPPVDERIQELRCFFDGLATSARQRIVERAANCISHGHPTYEIAPLEERRPENLLGLAIAGLGVGPLLADAIKLAEEQDSGHVRLTMETKDAKLLELQKRLYSLHLEAAELFDNDADRATLHGAALLGIPLTDAEELGLLTEGF